MQVTISFEKPAHMKTGGLAQKAAEVRDAGRHGDTVLVHVNQDELNFLKEHFGPGSTNPETGLPQFNIWDMLLPIAANVFLPGIGSAVGTGIGSMLGLGAESTLAPILGNALVGGGISALTGGDPLTGAVTGGLSGPVLNALGLTGQGGVLSGLNLMGNAASAAAKTPAPQQTVNSFTRGATEAAGTQSQTSALMKAAPLLLAASALGGAGKTEEAPAKPVQKDTRGLEPVQFTREQVNPNITTAYGYGPEQQFFKDNRLPMTAEEKKRLEAQGVQTAAEGRYVKGGGTGTSDDIPAKLSDGEYVIDAQTVSMLGDGSSDAGAQKLDQMRKEIRKHKGSALAKGKFAPDAKSPLSYVKGA